MPNETPLMQRTAHGPYSSVCEVPEGEGLSIDTMPDFFAHDTLHSTPHLHTFYEIIWFQEAGGVHTVDFRDYAVEAGSMFFLSPGQVHHFDGRTPHRGVIVRFCTDFLKDERAEADLFLKYNLFHAFDAQPYSVLRTPQAREAQEAIVEQMRRELRCPQAFGHLDMLRSLVKMFLINAQRYGEKQGGVALDDVKPSHRLFVRFRKLVETEYESLHTVRDYAQRLHVSAKTLTNSVGECAGKTPLAFINDRVLLAAKRLLRFTGLMVKEIAYRLGYDDPSYFVKFFKRHTGYLPSEFRELTAAREHPLPPAQGGIPSRESLSPRHKSGGGHYTYFHLPPPAHGESGPTQPLPPERL